ncbi:MAG: hypothetical protein PVF26_17635, partial [Desulfobacterales bacterium]
ITSRSVDRSLILFRHRPTQTYADKSFPRATLPDEKLYALRTTVQTILRWYFQAIEFNPFHKVK